ncbi:putative BsuMI modification methylase subunit YdiO [Mycobacterium antarcticum]|uniref:DNA cytosine methyltransferase n=1 Tax=Mycolicibacterium sp. TUM20983 TaxID=3023369 RepID=UPI00239A8E90|nr:DNA cytosine methyltransferase [Mycolicibacterium sp. TUM20983]GLP77510.1 putative BsuMI modification methylase subunit YdiO [Mycolicibacterium sp. TUM20983]
MSHRADVASDVGLERFRTRNGIYERHVARRDGRQTASVMAGYTGTDARPTCADEAERAWLQSTVAPPCGAARSSVRVVDLFSGCGGLSIGVAEAARALNRSFEPVLAVDVDAVAAKTYAANFPSGTTLCRDVDDVLPGEVGSRLTSAERLLAKRHADVDVLVGGPPCQGHSDFNNRTRHADDKNELYRTMVRAAEVLGPQHILIENVPGAINDRRAVVQRTADALADLGYHVSIGVIDLSEIGVPQRRRRLVLAASLTHTTGVDDVVHRHRRSPRDVAWAFQDLESQPEPTKLVDMVARSAPATRRRIDYLFESGEFDLPDRERPACHADGGHSYKAIYGRLAWDRPSHTITTGFYSMCMGRYVHPSRRRTITAHEAARLQYIPDWFSFDGVTQRTALARMIGNAVPSRLSYAVALEWLR